jgi:Terminase large subunit, T4likevirus-type, N-terminal
LSDQEYVHKNELKDYMWRRGDLRWKLHSTQRKMHDSVDASTSDEILILSSRQLGKSYYGVVYALEYCIKHPGSIVRILAPTLKQVQDIVNDNLAPITKDAPDGMIERHKTTYRWKVGDSTLRLGPLERATVDYNRGGNASLIITEEAGFVASDDYRYAIESVIGPQLLRSAGRVMHISSPSSDPSHVLHTDILPKTALNNALFRYTIYDNPQITEEQIEKAKKLCGGEESAAWRREYLAEIVRDESIIIVPTFDQSKHVKDFRIPDYGNWQVSIDFGGVRDKTAAILFCYDFLENKILIRDERIFAANTPTTEIVQGVLQMEAEAVAYGHEITARWADAPGQLQIDLERSHKFAIRVPRKDDWQSGINNMQVMFATDQVLVHPRCAFLIQSLDSGQYNDKRTDFARSDVLGHCDALAALSYGLRMVDRTSPLPTFYLDQNRTFIKQVPTPPMVTVAESIQPKVFSNDFSGNFNIKSFGTFRK